MILSPSALAIWAKSDRENTGQWHPLIAHMLDVAACVEVILELESPTTQSLFMQDWCLPWEQTRKLLACTIGLHDLGKCSPSFANLWKTGAERIESTGLKLCGDTEFECSQNPRRKYKIDYAHHGFITQLSLKEILKNWKWPKKLVRKLSDAVGMHHGLRATASTLKYCSDTKRKGSESWHQIRLELLEAMFQVTSASKKSKVDDLSAAGFIRLAGLTSFTDWMGSNMTDFPFAPEPGDLHTYYAERLRMAHASIMRLGWKPWTPLVQEIPSFEAACQYPPRPLQSAVSQAAKEVSEPSLFLIEAPMGEGKTEAAFYSHLCLQQRLGHRGLYVALPTQATGNAMFSRTLDFLQKMAKDVTLDLQLVHGASWLNESFEHLKHEGIYDESSDQDGRVRAAEWFTHKKRALLSEYGVGTVDQALMGILYVRHYFVRLWGLGNRTVVLDEVHAYDMYTSTLLVTLLEWLKALGASVIIMSATLPPTRRKQLLAAYGADKSALQEVPYPRLSVVNGAQTSVCTFETDPKRHMTLQILPLVTETELLAQEALNVLGDAGCLGIIVNTVQRAQEIYQVIRELEPEIDMDLFHARFPAGQRKEIEDRVLGKFGKTKNRPHRAILVATQVAEQSLDLDFDVMISDLAPIDLLLQRAGRMHRHFQNHAHRHSHIEPILYVAGLYFDDKVPHWKAPLYWDNIYDAYILLKTWWFLRSAQTIALPKDMDACIQAVYESSEPLPEWLLSKDLQAYGEYCGKNEAEQNQAHMVTIQSPEDGSWQKVPELERLDPEDNPDLNPAFLAKTRLGRPSIALIPIERNEAECIHEIPAFQEAKALFLKSLKVSNSALVNSFISPKEEETLSQKIKALWEQSPLLKHTYPLILEQGQALIDKTKVQLSPELGLCIETLRKEDYDPII